MLSVAARVGPTIASPVALALASHVGPTIAARAGPSIAAHVAPTLDRPLGIVRAPTFAVVVVRRSVRVAVVVAPILVGVVVAVLVLEPRAVVTGVPSVSLLHLLVHSRCYVLVLFLTCELTPRPVVVHSRFLSDILAS